MAFQNRELNELKYSVKIEEIIALYLKITPVAPQHANTNYKCPCPMCDIWQLDIKPRNNSFMCWHCQFGGDVFNFIQRMENLDFKEAVERLKEIKKHPKKKITWMKTLADGTEKPYVEIEKAREKWDNKIKKNEEKIRQLEDEIYAIEKTIKKKKQQIEALQKNTNANK